MKCAFPGPQRLRTLLFLLYLLVIVLRFCHTDGGENKDVYKLYKKYFGL